MSQRTLRGRKIRPAPAQLTQGLNQSSKDSEEERGPQTTTEGSTTDEEGDPDLGTGAPSQEVEPGKRTEKVEPLPLGREDPKPDPGDPPDDEVRGRIWV